MADNHEQVDIGIITIRDDEFSAVLDRFDDDDGWTLEKRRFYNIRRLQTVTGDSYRVAIVKSIEQGNGEAQEAARDLLQDLDPQWIMVVGIAGGVPDSDFTLGDVVVATRILEFSVEAVDKNGSREYQVGGGPLDRAVTKFVSNIPAMRKRLGPWNSRETIAIDRPPVTLVSENLYGTPEWRTRVDGSLNRHFGKTASRSQLPLVVTGPIVSSDRLIKNDEILQFFLKTGRHIRAVEMESAGIYRATHAANVPFSAVRGISDVIGLTRDPGWTEYACRSAASFAHALLRARPIEPRGPGPIAAGTHQQAIRRAAAPTPGDRWEQIRTRGILRCGAIKHPPLCDFEWKGGVAVPSGLYVDMCRAVCLEAGLVAEFVPVEWAQLPTAFLDMDLDLVLSTFDTPQRREFSSFTAPFYNVGVGGVILNGARELTSVEDLNQEDVTIVVTKGEVGWEYVVHELQIPKRRLRVLENADLMDMVDPVLSGRATVAICDAVSCHKIQQTYPRLKQVFRDRPRYVCRNAIMVPMNQQPLTNWIVEKFKLARTLPAVRALEQSILAEFAGSIDRFT